MVIREKSELEQASPRYIRVRLFQFKGKEDIPGASRDGQVQSPGKQTSNQTSQKWNIKQGNTKQHFQDRKEIPTLAVLNVQKLTTQEPFLKGSIKEWASSSHEPPGESLAEGLMVMISNFSL